MLYAINNNGFYSAWTIFFIETDIDHGVLEQLTKIPTPNHSILFKGNEITWYEGEPSTLENYVKDCDFGNHSLEIAKIDAISVQCRVDILNFRIKVLQQDLSDWIDPEDWPEDSKEAYENFHKETIALIKELKNKIDELSVK